MNSHQALICPQCGGTLPRQALWRLVVCHYCAANVTLSRAVVQAADFHAAFQRAQVTPVGAQVVQIGRFRYQVLRHLGRGEHAEVLLAQRLGIAAELVVLKWAYASSNGPSLLREHQQLLALQALQTKGAAYFSTRLPQVVDCAQLEQRPCLVLRHPSGYWGSLDHVQRNHRIGLDARHIVWIWRRVLEVLGFLHENGWSHGNLQLAHLLVQPSDHGIQLISFSAAQLRSGQAQLDAAARDLRQSAWAMRALLAGSNESAPALPPHIGGELAKLFLRASDDGRWCQQQGAQGIEQALQAAARATFGAPRFMHFHVTPQ